MKTVNRIFSLILFFAMTVTCLGCMLENEETTDMEPNYPNDKVTASQLTPMIVGQAAFGGSLNQAGLIPETYTLEFSFISVEKRTGGALSFIPSAEAVINWKVDGQQQRRVISIVSGAVISAVANGVDVQIVDVPTSDLTLTGKHYQVQTTLSRGARANIQQPPILYNRSLNFADIAPANTFSVDIPPDCGVINAYVSVVFANPAATFVFSDITATFGTSTGDLGGFYPLIANSWVPIPPGADRIQIQNNNAAHATVSVLWGIEG
jgi:hypothetical protein